MQHSKEKRTVCVLKRTLRNSYTDRKLIAYLPTCIPLTLEQEIHSEIRNHDQLLQSDFLFKFVDKYKKTRW